MKEQSFEKNLQELETIVSQLEGGKLSLEDSISVFEKGMKLTAKCQKRLDEAEQKIELLMKNREGKITSQPFETETEGMLEQ